MDFNILKMLYKKLNNNNCLYGIGEKKLGGAFRQRNGHRSRNGLFKKNQRHERKLSRRRKMKCTAR